MKAPSLGFAEIVESGADVLGVTSAAPGPRGRLPLTAEMLRDSPSGDIFGLTQNAGMGWDPRELGRPQYLILSTQGGVRVADGRPIALGYHTGHWEVGLLMQAAAKELARLECLPFAAFCSDPCDGRTQGTTGMMDSCGIGSWGGRCLSLADYVRRPKATAGRPPPEPVNVDWALETTHGPGWVT